MQGRWTCNLRLILRCSHHSSQPSLLSARSTNSPCSVPHVISVAMCFVLHHLLIAVSGYRLHAHGNYRPPRRKLAPWSFACSMNSDRDHSENRPVWMNNECIGEFSFKSARNSSSSYSSINQTIITAERRTCIESFHSGNSSCLTCMTPTQNCLSSSPFRQGRGPHMQSFPDRWLLPIQYLSTPATGGQAPCPTMYPGVE